MHDVMTRMTTPRFPYVPRYYHCGQPIRPNAGVMPAFKILTIDELPPAVRPGCPRSSATLRISPHMGTTHARTTCVLDWTTCMLDACPRTRSLSLQSLNRLRRSVRVLGHRASPGCLAEYQLPDQSRSDGFLSSSTTDCCCDRRPFQIKVASVVAACTQLPHYPRPSSNRTRKTKGSVLRPSPAMVLSRTVTATIETGP